MKDSRIGKQLLEACSAVLNEVAAPADGGAVALCVTLPAKTEWSEYEKELADVADGRKQMNFKVPSVPRRVKLGDRCYVCHRGRLVGWMAITGIGGSGGFECQTTGRKWTAGTYVSRSGPFHYLKTEVPMRGFQGFRYVTPVD